MDLCKWYTVAGFWHRCAALKFLFTNTYVPLIREITVPLNPIGTIYTTARTLWRKRKQRHPAILRNSSR